MSQSSHHDPTDSPSPEGTGPGHRYTSASRRRWRRFQASAPIALALLGGLFYLLHRLRS